MPYDVITIDTNIFDRNGLRLEKGMLAQFGQFRESAIRFVLSEIVYNEVEKHLANRAKEVKSSLERAIKQSTENNFFSPEVENQIEIIYDSSPEPEDVAKDRLSAFVEATGAEIIPAQLTEIDDLDLILFVLQ